MTDYKINPEPIEDKSYLVAYFGDQFNGSNKYSTFYRGYFADGKFWLTDVSTCFPIKPDLWIEMPDSNEIAHKKPKCSCYGHHGFMENMT